MPCYRPPKWKKCVGCWTRGDVSQRQIARELEISRGSVNAIASGKRPDYPVKELDEDDIRCWLPPVRCSGCGGMVYAPCRLCRVRAVQSGQRSPADAQRFHSAPMEAPNTISVNDASPIKLDRCQVPANRVAAADHPAVDFPVVDPPADHRVDAETRLGSAGRGHHGHFA